MENNDCYEAKTRTSKEDKQFKENLLNVCGNFAKVGLDCIEKQNDELEQLQNEKQQLVSFLENGIKKCSRSIEFFKTYKKLFKFDRYIFGKSIKESILEQVKTKEVYEYVLDFVNKEGKE